ncbi:MAG: restriction endonuclease subunit S [Magnetococcales bacterium]|nr:restriction endonuclease subunit S [Magnetococcales bacterium]
MDDLCEITSSKRIFAADYVSEGVPFFRGREITEKYKGNLDISIELFITEEKFREIERKFGAPKQGDLLLTSVGTLGSVYVVKPGDRFYFKDGNLTWFRHFKGLDSQFLYYWISSPQGKAELQKCTIGSSQSAFTIVLLKSMEIELPPLPIQRRIAGILSAYDDLIENNQRRIKILETMARTLYREWFVHFRFPGHENVRRVASPLGEIPEGWEVKPLESLMVDHIGGGWGKDTPDEKHSEPAWVIRGTDIPDARISQSIGVPYRYHAPSNLRSRKLSMGDIVFEVSGGSKGQPVGRTLLITRELLSAFNGDVICASFCKRIRPRADDYGAELLYLTFLEGYESGEIEQFQVQSTGISNFKWTDYISKTERIVPPKRLLSCFREQVSTLLMQIATLGLQSQTLRRTRDLLLPRLLSGQIDVEAMPDA